MHLTVSSACRIDTCHSIIWLHVEKRFGLTACRVAPEQLSPAQWPNQLQHRRQNSMAALLGHRRRVQKLHSLHFLLFAIASCKQIILSHWNDLCLWQTQAVLSRWNQVSITDCSFLAPPWCLCVHFRQFGLHTISVNMKSHVVSFLPLVTVSTYYTSWSRPFLALRRNGLPVET